MYIVLVILTFTCLYRIYLIIVKMTGNRKHLSDDILRKIITTEIRQESNYDQAIAHLGVCKKCEERLMELSVEE